MSELKLDPIQIQQLIDQAVEQNILSAVEHLGRDPVWLEKIERMINQAVVQRTLAGLNSIDVTKVIHDHVDRLMPTVEQRLKENFNTAGISDQASATQLTVMDQTVVVENQLVARDLQIVKTAQIQDLVVRGVINTDNRSWDELKESIARKTLDQIDQEWTQKLVQETKRIIQEDGIDFDRVSINGTPLVDGPLLNSSITESNLQKVGRLRDLQIQGDLQVNTTMNVLNRRVGINTIEPEMSLTIWDDEVVINVGKYKANQAYIGTSRNQGISLGVNRNSCIDIDTDGLTAIKKLRVGLHRIMFDIQVPGWSGTRGDLVFNSNPSSDQVFAWVCLGGHKWQSLRSA